MGDDVVFRPSEHRLDQIAECCNGTKALCTLILRKYGNYYLPMLTRSTEAPPAGRFINPLIMRNL